MYEFIKKFLKTRLSSQSVRKLNELHVFLSAFVRRLMYPYGRFIKTPVKLLINGRKGARKLEIGPGPKRIPGFETINIVWGTQVDYVADASRKLPFADSCFDLIYASHVLEHIPWYMHENVLDEWRRIIKPGGQLELWVPNGLLIAKTFVNAEEGTSNDIHRDGWYKFNDEKDPCVWANGRIFSYGDGSGRKGDPNWHLSLFSPRRLRDLLLTVGFLEVQELSRNDIRGYDHGWINLGFSGRKP